MNMPRIRREMCLGMITRSENDGNGTEDRKRFDR